MIEQNILSPSFIYLQDSKRKEDRPGELPLGKVTFFQIPAIINGLTQVKDEWKFHFRNGVPSYTYDRKTHYVCFVCIMIYCYFLF